MTHNHPEGIKGAEAAAAAIFMARTGRSKEEITEFYEDIVRLDHRKTLYYKTISNYDALNFMSQKYGIDFDRLDTDFAIREKKEGEK